MRRLSLWLQVTAFTGLPGCYRVPLAPQSLLDTDRVAVVVARDQAGAEALPALHLAGDEEPASGWAVIGAELVRQLAAKGWQARRVREVPRTATGALLDPAWPVDLCQRVRSIEAEVALWVAIELTWREPTSPTLQAELRAHLIDCRSEQLLWRDRVIRETGLAQFGPAGMNLAHGEAVGLGAASADAVGYLVESLSQP